MWKHLSLEEIVRIIRLLRVLVLSIVLAHQNAYARTIFLIDTSLSMNYGGTNTPALAHERRIEDVFAQMHTTLLHWGTEPVPKVYLWSETPHQILMPDGSPASVELLTSFFSQADAAYQGGTLLGSVLTLLLKADAFENNPRCQHIVIISDGSLVTDEDTTFRSILPDYLAIAELSIVIVGYDLSDLMVNRFKLISAHSRYHVTKLAQGETNALQVYLQQFAEEHHSVAHCTPLS